MSIQPIDLQTLFLKMTQVGKDQAVEKDSIMLQQTLQGHEIAKRNQHSDNSVNKANNSDAGPEKTKEDKEQGGNHDQKKRKKEKNKTFEDKEILSDPDLGKNIDISG
ncbi:MAG: hypothetical protein FWE72_02025 [Spirochaetaceae bacterium]|nr:hypothetical protein [Spirochaetaceae bacterium]